MTIDIRFKISGSFICLNVKGAYAHLQNMLEQSASRESVGAYHFNGNECVYVCVSGEKE